MSARLTDLKKKKILADYLESGSYRATAKKNGVSDSTVKRIIVGSSDFMQKAAQKKEENTADILAYMDSQKNLVCEIIAKGLAALNEPDKLAGASPSQITTAIGTLIDKWAMISGGPSDNGKEDELSKSLREMAEELESDD